jgi:hypothetical protein
MVEDGIRFQGDKMLSLSTGEVWNGVELATPESIKFSDYAGDWFSPDLDVFYRFTAKDGHLVWSSSLNRLGFEPISRDLTPSTRDQFWFGESPNGTNFEFIRDTRGTVTGLIVTHPRARNIRFERATGNR